MACKVVAPRVVTVQITPNRRRVPDTLGHRVHEGISQAYQSCLPRHATFSVGASADTVSISQLSNQHASSARYVAFSWKSAPASGPDADPEVTKAVMYLLKSDQVGYTAIATICSAKTKGPHAERQVKLC
jgi:hypothetical protein